jgi:hypothetical protein
MNRSRRRVLCAATVALWVLWVAALWGGETHDVGPGHRICEMVLRVTAVTAAIAWAMAALVAPLVETARIWRDIGRREARKDHQCDECRRQRQNLAAVIPIRSIGTRRVHSDS